MTGAGRYCGPETSETLDFAFPLVTEVDEDRLESGTKSTCFTSTGVEPPGDSCFTTLISGIGDPRLSGLVERPALVRFLEVDGTRDTTDALRRRSICLVAAAGAAVGRLSGGATGFVAVGRRAVVVLVDCDGLSVSAVLCTQPDVRAATAVDVFCFFFGGLSASASEPEDIEIARFVCWTRSFVTTAGSGFRECASGFAGIGFRRNAGTFHASGS